MLRRKACMDIALSERSQVYLREKDSQYKETFWNELNWFLCQLDYYLRDALRRSIEIAELQLSDILYKTFLFFRTAPVKTIQEVSVHRSETTVSESELANLVTEMYLCVPKDTTTNLSVSQCIGKLRGQFA